MTAIQKCAGCNAVLPAPGAPCDVCGVTPKPLRQEPPSDEFVCGPGPPKHGTPLRREFADELQRARGWIEEYRAAHSGVSVRAAALEYLREHPKRTSGNVGKHAAAALGGSR
jgi:hypothetical protein